MTGLIVGYIMLGLIFGCCSICVVEPESDSGVAKCFVYTVFWPLTILLIIIFNVPGALAGLLPDRSEVKMSRRQRRTIMFKQEENRVTQEKQRLQIEAENIVMGRV